MKRHTEDAQRQFARFKIICSAYRLHPIQNSRDRGSCKAGDLQSQSANLADFDTEQGSEFFDFVADLADADRAVMRRTAFRPLVHEAFGSDAEFVAAVGVAD